MILIQNKFQKQLKKTVKILKKNKKLVELIKILDEYSKENNNFNNWYVAAGCINQTVFNYLHNYDIENNINDYDIVYFDQDTSYEAEDVIIKELQKRIKHLNIEVDIKNQKRVPIWYKEKYNREIKEYTSTEDAIKSWTSTVTCIGLTLENNKYFIYAPYGLDDLFNMEIKPVKVNATKEIFEEKANKWKSKWPKLTIKEWDE